MEMNEILDKLPRHLLSLVIDQPYNSYTAQDHALWRYVMRQNVQYLSRVAHGSYLEGLRKTGISLDRIPNMYGMNRILREIGWAAVCVDGFIPPSAFMEFQAHNVLVIAADIRPIDQIGYTSAPDIIHEAAGHAPIIADPVYAGYLKRFGEVGSKAFSSAHDNRMYEAIRHLSILKADPYTDKDSVKLATNMLEELSALKVQPSELSLIRNLHWWTVEYGLIGDLKHPKIYGAGLLSSIAESYYCMQPQVLKLPYNSDTVNYNFDITEPQPQLFVTPDFDTLTRVLEDFTCRMALRQGGSESLKKAIDSENTATCEYSSGLQVSGTFTELIDKNGKPAYIRTTGPTSLCFGNKEIEGHGKDYHAHGFGSPVGFIRGLNVHPEDATDTELSEAGIIPGQMVTFEFESGVEVSGCCRNILRKKGKILIISFSECKVKYAGRILFEPSWGMYDMAIGAAITSAWAGPADPVAFQLAYQVPSEKTHKIAHTKEALALHKIYDQVRDLRDGKTPASNAAELWKSLTGYRATDWLCALELLEIVSLRPEYSSLASEILKFLEDKKATQQHLGKLIDDGLAMIGSTTTN
jgi:phenylalanine-4-hydroxylase